jgi:hypothetical protein
VTINALDGTSVLASVVFDLPPPAVPGHPGTTAFADTSRFARLSGITGYRIDRHELGDGTGNWAADDFSFAAVASVPEPPSLQLSLVGLAVLGGMLAVSARGLRSTDNRASIKSAYS